MRFKAMHVSRRQRDLIHFFEFHKKWYLKIHILVTLKNFKTKVADDLMQTNKKVG